MLGEGLPDKLADGGRVAARKRQDGRSRPTQAYPENVRAPVAEHLSQARHQAGPVRLMPVILKELGVEIRLAGKELRSQSRGAL